jgi:hypothetical protein
VIRRVLDLQDLVIENFRLDAVPQSFSGNLLYKNKAARLSPAADNFYK